ncbi:MAG: hypothetical protein R8L07_21150 [Alphaproteobacteria bacterium]|nr:hypothetical protein [Alphaproteobacteria bacterium]
MSYFAFANLNERDLHAIKELETRLGRPLVALKEVEMAPAQLDEGALSQVKALESKLGVALVAVN